MKLHNVTRLRAVSMYICILYTCAPSYLCMCIFLWRNYFLVFGLITETSLGVFLAYCPGLEGALRMYGLRYIPTHIALYTSTYMLSWNNVNTTTTQFVPLPLITPPYLLADTHHSEQMMKLLWISAIIHIEAFSVVLASVVNINLSVFLTEGNGGVLRLVSVLSSLSMMSSGSGLLENTQMVS